MRRAGVRRLLSAPGLCYQRAPRTPYVRHPISSQSRHQQQHQQQQQLCTATRPAAFSASGTHPRAPPAAEEADLLFGYLPRESLPTSSLTNTGMSYTKRFYPDLSKIRTKWEYNTEKPMVGKTADEMLVKRVQWMTDEQRMEQFKLQRVTVNDEPVGPDRVLAHQEVLRMHIPAPADVFDPATIPLDVLHDQDGLVCVNKQPGIPVQPAGKEQLENLLSAMHARFRNMEDPEKDRVPFPIHRLDRHTSGVTLFALDRKLASRIASQFENHMARKEYLALVQGVPKEREGLVDGPIAKLSETGLPTYHVHEDGRSAQTDYSVVETFGDDDYALVSFRPRTGRTHQIRVHAAHLGHPIICDTRYGGLAFPGPPSETSDAGDGSAAAAAEAAASSASAAASAAPFAPSAHLTRCALHAHRLHIRDPASGENITFEAPLPLDMANAMAWMRKNLPMQSSKKPRIEKEEGQ